MFRLQLHKPKRILKNVRKLKIYIYIDFARIYDIIYINLHSQPLMEDHHN